jgi:hypothetical protein
MAVIRKREKRTNTRRSSLGALSRLEIWGRAHDVRSSGSCQNTRVRVSVSKSDQDVVFEYSTEKGDDGVKTDTS